MKVAVLRIGAATAALWAMLITASEATALPEQAPPDVTGMTLVKAEAALSAVGLHPVVQTVIGDQKAKADCTVTRQQSIYVPAAQNTYGPGHTEVRLSLNCNESVATAKSPGNSPESPAGQAAAKASPTSTGPAPAG
jgi:hypothetical protein